MGVQGKMREISRKILNEFQVRKTKKQKEEFREYIENDFCFRWRLKLKKRCYNEKALM